MPSLNEIAEFRKDLKRIAHEEQVTEKWKEKVYDELPPPDEEAMPDLDDLLTSLEAHQEDPMQQQEMQNTLSSPNNETSAIDTTHSSNNNETSLLDNEEMQDSSSTTLFDDAEALNFDDMLSSLDLDSEMPSDDSSLTDNSSLDAQEALESPAASDDTDIFSSNFDDMLSSLDLDSEMPSEDSFLTDDSSLNTQEALENPAASDDTDIFSSDFDDMLSSLDLDSEMPSEDSPFTDDSSLDAQEALDTPAASNDNDAFSSDFDDILSSLDLDSEMPSEDSPLADTEPLDTKETLDSPTAFDDTDAFSSDFDDMLSSLDFDSEIPSEDSPLTDDSSLNTKETLDSPAAFDDTDAFSSDFDDMLSSLDFDSEMPSEDSPFTDDSSLDPIEGLDTIPALDDAQPFSSEFDVETAIPENNDDALNELSLFSEDQSPSEITSFDDSLQDEEAGDELVSDVNNLPIFDDDNLFSSFSDDDDSSNNDPDIAISDASFEADSHDDTYDNAGFSLEDNILDTDILDSTDNQFNLPDTFKDFSSNNIELDSLIEKTTQKDSPIDSDQQALTDEEYARFLSRVESFPLNMRIAIQDYIGNGNDSDENKLNLIRLVLSKASIKKIAARLEKILNKSIPIPKHFQSSSVEEYERQKKTFKYWMLHKFLPVAVMTALALLFIFCISVLSWQFIYKPIKSENLYKVGYAYLENGQYDTAIEKFDKACEYKQKKKWYFTYARGFRNKKLFSAAEKMYNRLIYDFKYDKYAGLEYADMLASELRNYERAETVIRRLILDHHVNDKEGLTALGDIYMTWGYENPEKYEAAVKIYSRIIELYGKSDALLVRMLRYFIRTDNLAEVLPLKEYFVTRLSKMPAQDITELGGYLLEKRYNPLPLDSEKLRAKIDDVRLLLEKAIQADNSIPESYYNLGRFFIYNYKPHAAVENLTESIKRFEKVGPMPPLRTVRYIDSMRLLGEQLTNQKKYLDAQSVYAQALTLYKDYTALNALPANQTIGKLYADYGDIDYFVSRDFDSALDSYQNAIKESYNTPSINYRIGYLHYQKEDYGKAIEFISNAYKQKLHDKNLLYGFGNALFKRGNYFAAQAVYEQLMELLDVQRVHKGILNPGKSLEDAEFIENYMHTVTNLGTTLNQIAERNGDSQKNARALALYAEGNRAWDALTRNPQTMVRSKSVGLSYLNTQNMLNPSSTYKPEIYSDIPMTLENEKVLQQKEDK